MRSVSGVDLVSRALHSTLALAKKRFNLSNPGSISKKKRKEEKRLENKLKRQFARLKDPLTETLLPNVQPYFNEFGSDWNLASIRDFEIEFEPAEDEYSEFISKIKDKYVCLNPSVKPNKKVEKAKNGKKVRIGQNKSANSSSNSETKPLLSSSTSVETTFVKDDDVDSGLGLELFPLNTVSLLQQLRKKKLEARRKKKSEKKEANKLEEQKQKLLKLKGKKKKMKDILSRSESNGDCEKTNITLPQPKIVLYPREKIIQGWKGKYHYGCGFHNLGNSCYMNATLQALFHTPSFINWLLHDDDHFQRCRSSSQTYQQCLVCAMSNTLKESLNRQNQTIRPIQVHNKLKAICKHFVNGRQEDAHEFLRYLLESMERSYLTAINALRIDNRSRETSPLGQIFGGYLRTEVTCLKCNFISTTFQPLAELQLDIRHVTTLEDAINNHFKKERLDNNDYKCEKCHMMSPATKQFSLELPPIVLCLQLKRFTFSGGKISKPIHCNRSLNLNRFLHKSLRENHANVEYRLVGLVTHIGSSPHCGHYTAIAEASNGNFYQFDDSYVRPVSQQTALNTDAYVIIYEMVSNSTNENEKSTVNSNNLTGLSNSYKPGRLTNGIKPTATVTKPENSPQTNHKKVVNPFLVTTLVENGSGISKSATQTGVSSVTSIPNRLFNGYGSSLTSKDRPPVQLIFNKTSAPATSGVLGNPNPKIQFKNPNTPIQSTSSYLTNSSRAKLAATTKIDVEDESNSSAPHSPHKPSASPTAQFPKLKTNNSLSVIPKRDVTSLVTPTAKIAPSMSTTFSSPIGVKLPSPTKISIERPSKLVAYDSDDDDEKLSDGEIKTPKPEATKEEKQEQKTSSVAPKLFPVFAKTSVKSWDGTVSALSSTMDGSRKRSLEKSKEDLYNEELDSGKVKKSRNNLKSKSRSPVQEYPRCHGRNSASSNSNSNKLQRYEDNRRSSELMHSLQQHSATSTGTSGLFPKPKTGFPNRNGYNDNYYRNNDGAFESSESNSSNGSRSNSEYFAKKGYFFNKHNYGYNNVKRYNNNSNSNYHSSSSNYNSSSSYNKNYRSYPNSNNWKQNGSGKYNDSGRFNGNKFYGRHR